MKRFLFALGSAALLLTSCSDTTESLGLELVPDDNIVSSQGTVIPVTFENFEVDEDSVYTNSTTAYLGKYTDDIFGQLEAGYMTQLYCLNNFSFEFDKVVKDSIGKDEETGKAIFDFKDASCYINLEYTDFFGDSINPCQVEAYILNKDIDGTIPSSVDPKEYYDEKEGFLGKVTYTAANTYIDQDKRGDDRSLIISLDDKYAQQIMNLNYSHPEYFKDVKEFNKHVMKGIYLKPSKGNGTVLYVTNSMLNINFTMYVDSAGVYPIKRKEPGFEGQDSTKLYSTSFNSTREVYQVNTFNNKINDEVLNDPDHTYIKSPAGIYTTVKIPLKNIVDKIGNDTILQIRLTLQAYNQMTENEYGMGKPENLVLLEKDKVYSFFRFNKLPDNKSSFNTQLDTDTNKYTFENISEVVVKAIAEARKNGNGNVPDDALLELVAVPVTAQSEKDSSGSTSLISVKNDLKPEYTKLVKAGNMLEVLHIKIGQ